MTIHFFLGYGLSLIGSLPFGIINMAVAHTALRKGLSAALWMAAGASLIEFLQAFIALKFTWMFVEGSLAERILQAAAVAIFLCGGIYFFFFAKNTPPSSEALPVASRRNEFAKGMMVSTLNVLAIPYWIIYGAILSGYGWLKMENEYVLIFSAGTAIGTFTTLFAYASLGSKVLSKSGQVTKWINKFIGLVLVGFGVYQIWKLVFGQ